MKKAIGLSFVFAGVLAAWVALVPAGAQAQEAPKVAIPQSGVPQIMTMEGKFVRAAYNNEGYVILGYQVVNRSIGEEWVLLEIGATARDGVEAFKLMRGDFSLEIPDGKTIPLPTDSEVRAANTVALQNRTKVQRDSINYFPPSATRACRIGFFAELTSPVMAYDEVEISNTRACLGRLFFKVPGGITYGQYWLNVKFPKSLIRVPFRVLTEAEEKTLSKNYKDISKQVKDAFKPPKK